MYTAVLILHVLSAIVAGGVSVASLLGVYYQRFSWPLSHARFFLYTLSAWLVFSGALLAVLSPNVTALSVCDNLALYLAFLAIPLVVLQRDDSVQSRFETVSRNSLVGAALLFIGTLALGL